MHELTIAELNKALSNKEVSSTELTRHFLQRIKDINPKINAYITVCEDEAIQNAIKADECIAKGEQQTLTGIPIAHKDIFCTDNILTSCGSKMLSNFIAPYNATVVEKFNQSKAVFLGKTNMDEFAMGSSSETSYFGPVKNPWNTDHVPGGSSGGSAACVAAGLSVATTGTDTGGSIRQPAALCGITGLKPSYGRVSRWGMIAFASSLDQAGPMTKTAEDAALMLNVMAGFDEKDSTSLQLPQEDFTKNLNQSLKGKSVGLPKIYFNKGLDAEVEKNIEEVIKIYEKCGANIVEIDLPHSDLSIAAYYVIAPAECSSNLSRFDGIRFGYRAKNPENLDQLYIQSRTEGFGEEVKRRILIGTYALSAGYYDAYYLKAQKIRKLIKNSFDQAFKKVDLILGPTSPTPAFKLKERVNDPVSMYLSDVYTIAVNLAGLPAISLPAGFVNNLPVGVQLIAQNYQESLLLNAGHQLQQHSNWHQQHASC